MLTPEIIRRDYYGPRAMDSFKGEPIGFRWHRRGWSYPRRTYWLFYLPGPRTFGLRVTEKRSRRADIKEVSGPVPVSDIDAFRACLPPDLLARCLAASFALTRSNHNA